MPLPNGQRSASDADNASMFRFCVAFTVLFVMIALMTYGNLFNTYFFDYFKAGVARETNGFMKMTHYLGVIAFAGSIYWLWKMAGGTFGNRTGWVYFAVALGLVALGIGLAAGFNFDLHGIEPGA